MSIIVHNFLQKSLYIQFLCRKLDKIGAVNHVNFYIENLLKFLLRIYILDELCNILGACTFLQKIAANSQMRISAENLAKFLQQIR